MIPATEYFTDVEGTIPAKPGDAIAFMRVGALTYVQETLAHRPTLIAEPRRPAFDGVDDVMYVKC